MSISSKFPDHECKKCGVTIKKGDAVNKVPAGNWCSNEQCPNPPKAVPGPAEVAAAPGPETNTPSLRNFVRDQSYIIQTIEANVLETVPEETKKNGQKVGMYVKEIYRTWTNKMESKN
jgi:hypothetical protein